MSRWGHPVQPPTHPMWGPYGVWVPYPPTVPMVHQMQGHAAGHNTRSSVFSRLNFGQSDSNNVGQKLLITSRKLPAQEKGKAPMKQVYVPKKKAEISTAPA